MTEFTRKKSQAWRCHEGQHSAMETMDGMKRCAYCGFPMTPETAVKDAQAELDAIFKTDR